MNYTKEDLLAHLSAWEQKLGRVPYRDDIRTSEINDFPYRKLFGSWKAAISEYLGAKVEVPCGAQPPSGNKDRLLETLGNNLSETELKTLVASTGVTSKRPALAGKPHHNGYFKFLLCSDTHIGHSKFREDWWHDMIDHASDENVDFCYHVGDILEGMSNRPGHVYELSQIGFEAQFNKARALFADCPFEIRAIIGNHDEWYCGKSDQGINVGVRLEESLDNFVYLGTQEADEELEGVKIKLWHGTDGAAYSTSYRSQKFVEQLDGGEKPHILLTGHDHKAIFHQCRNVHVIASGTLCEQTSFMRGKKLAAHKGYWIVECWSNEEGLIRIRPEWNPRY